MEAARIPASSSVPPNSPLLPTTRRVSLRSARRVAAERQSFGSARVAKVDYPGERSPCTTQHSIDASEVAVQTGSQYDAPRKTP